MYKCDVCGAASRPGEPLIKVVVHKRDRPSEIAREVPVCRACAEQVRMGMTLAEVKRSVENQRAPAEEPVAAPTKPKAVTL